MTDKLDAVTEQAQLDALDAAYKVLSPLGRPDDRGVGTHVKLILQAIKAINNVQVEAQKKLDTDKDEWLVLDSVQIAASALWAVTCGDGVEDVHPHCIGGHPFIAFARACLILEAAANYEILVNDYNEAPSSDGYIDESLEAVIKAEEDAERNQDEDDPVVVNDVPVTPVAPPAHR